jgi:Thioredoxin-like
MISSILQRKGVPRSHSNASYFHANGSLLLPVTQPDRTAATGLARVLRRRKVTDSFVEDGAIGSISVATVGRVFAIISIFFVTITILKTVVRGSAATEELELDVAAAAANGGGLRRNNYWETMDEQKLPLSDYPSIQYALDHSDIVLLYFAAAWCPLSAPITQLLDEKFGDIFLPPRGSHPGSISYKRRPISLVYVSSDESEKQMLEYTHKNWIDVPFNSQERTALKKQFKVAAKREMEVLDMEHRIYEIPTIIIVSGESHNVITTHGVDDLKEKGSEALIYWIKLLHTVKALEDKY